MPKETEDPTQLQLEEQKALNGDPKAVHWVVCSVKLYRLATMRNSDGLCSALAITQFLAECNCIEQNTRSTKDD